MKKYKDIILLPLAKLGKKESIDTYVKMGVGVLLLVCIFSRVCLYVFPKEIWNDEALLYHSITSHCWLALLQGNLGNIQSAPLLFVLLNKFIISYVGHTTIYLYFFPFFCSILSVLGIFFVSKRIGDILYTFSTLLLFSFCIAAIYYSNEFKQYSTELLISLVLLYIAVKSSEDIVSNFFSFKNILLYCVCILFSSTSILFLAGLLSARIIIDCRQGALQKVCDNWWRLLFLLAFIAVYYFCYLKVGNSEAMKAFWRPTFIPLSWDGFWHYWTKGHHVFVALFSPASLAVVVLLGLVGGSALLWHTRKDLFLYFSLPVVVTFGANCFFYPPGAGSSTHGARFLLFLLPNAVLVAGWFYAWLLRQLAVVLSSGKTGTRRLLPSSVGRVVFLGVLLVLVALSVGVNGRYLYAKAYHIQQIEELIRIFRCNATPESLNLVYAMSEPVYRYYQQDAPKMRVEILPRDFAPAKARLEHLPKNQRVLLLISHYQWHLRIQGLREIEKLFTAQGREYIKIPAKGTILYILPRMY